MQENLGAGEQFKKNGGLLDSKEWEHENKNLKTCLNDFAGATLPVAAPSFNMN